MTAPQVTVFSGTPPARTQSQEDFNINMASWVAFTTASPPEYNLISSFVNTQAIAAETSANTAATAINSVNFKGAWSGLTGSLNVPSVVYHNGQYWQLLNNIADVTTSQPGVSSDWVIAQSSQSRSVIATPLTLSVGGRYFVTGNGTITLPEPSVLADGVTFNISTTTSYAPIITGGASKIRANGNLYTNLTINTAEIELTVASGIYEV